MHQPRYPRVTVAWNEWVGSHDMGPWLSKAIRDFVFISSRNSSKSLGVFA